MSETKHTPGPWAISKEFDCHELISAGEVRVVQTYCEALSKDKLPPGERAANARLIAAAPELLEALKLIEWTRKESGEMASCNHCGRWQAYGHGEDCIVSAAIAKAEGHSEAMDAKGVLR